MSNFAHPDAADLPHAVFNLNVLIPMCTSSHLLLRSNTMKHNTPQHHLFPAEAVPVLRLTHREGIKGWQSQSAIGHTALVLAICFPQAKR
eukprot:scaffold1707_cov99-Skeletonema_menzelii.AAC.1